MNKKIKDTAQLLNFYTTTSISPRGNPFLAKKIAPIKQSDKMIKYIHVRTLVKRNASSTQVAAYVQDNNFSQEVQEQVEIQIKYAGYIEKEKQNADKLNRLEAVKIPKILTTQLGITISRGQGEISQIMPETISQASRISGINLAIFLCF